MKKPRRDSAQSAIEYVVIFAIVAVASVLLANSMPGIFANYTANSANCITEGECGE